MPLAPVLADESERLTSLQACGILDTPPDPRFDALTRVAARMFDAPIALVSLVDAKRQWFKSAVGLMSGGETHRDLSFCAHAILTPEQPLVVEDATKDPRFADNELVNGPPGIRFYAGVPLLDRERRALGTLCVVDTVPRQPAPGALETLRDLAAGVSAILELSRSTSVLREAEEHHRSSVELSPQIPWTADPAGQILEAGPQWEALTGLKAWETTGSGWLNAVHAEDRPATCENWEHSLRTGEPVDLEYRVRCADGEYRWFRAYAAPRRDASGNIIRWYGALEDIHGRKLAEMALQESEALASSVVDHSPDCIRVVDLQGHLLFMNEAGLRLLGIDNVGLVRGQRWDAVLPVENAQACEAALETARNGGTARFLVHGREGGPMRWWDVTVCPITGPDGRPERILSIARDTTETKLAREAGEEAHRAAAEAVERLSSVLESTTDSVLVLDREWRITFINGRAAQLFHGRSLAIGENVWNVFPEERGGIFHERYQIALAQQVPVAFEAYSLALSTWLEVHAFPTKDGLSIFFRDVAARRQAELEKQRAEERLAYMAGHDALTGLANRTALQDGLGQALQDAKPGEAVALLCLDLDHFKAVNDTFGHLTGDVLLRQVAARLRLMMLSTDLIIRFGGDEFAVLHTGIRDRAVVGQLARRILATVSAPYDVDGRVLHLGVSIGIALSPCDGTDAEQLFRKADLALYRAKASSRGSFRFYEAEMDARQQQRQELKLSLRGAVDRNELYLLYQPLVNLRTRQVSGLEALLRWRHPERGTVSPADFIPVAEESDIIVKLGNWALQQACQDALSWPENIDVAVNLSPAQFRQQDLAQSVRDVLRSTGLSATRLQLEITESVLLHEDARNIATLHALRDLGARIVMDDFGTGYSSLGYLRRFPFNKIKVDRSFISDLPASEGSAKIVRSVVALGQSLGIATLAEGVETEQQLETLRQLGCDEVQGYFLSRPVAAADVPDLLRRKL